MIKKIFPGVDSVEFNNELCIESCIGVGDEKMKLTPHVQIRDKSAEEWMMTLKSIM